MTVLSKEQATRRERTLLIALLLSLPGPLVTGLAALSSHSTTQLADFIRRSVELVALFLSWWVFYQLQRNTTLDEGGRSRLERTAGLGVAAAMICSGIVMLLVALSRWSVFEPGGAVIPGLVIAFLGLLTNAWFWRRYTLLNHEHYSPVIAAQQKLYRAKASVDLCVVLALAAVTVAPSHPGTHYVDVLGSIIVAGYLFWSGLRLAQSHSASTGGLFGRLGRLPISVSWRRSQEDND
jgi:divalent metal cation (Fe/Co/Zn/Cd) transporter